MVDPWGFMKNVLDAHGAWILGGAIVANLAHTANKKSKGFKRAAEWDYVKCVGCGRGGYSDEMRSGRDASGKDHYSCARCSRPDLFKQAESDQPQPTTDWQESGILTHTYPTKDPGYGHDNQLLYYLDWDSEDPYPTLPCIYCRTNLELVRVEKKISWDGKPFDHLIYKCNPCCLSTKSAEGDTDSGKWFILNSYDYLWLGVIPHEAMEPNHGSVKLEREDFQEPDDADFFDIDQVYFDRDWFQHYYGHDRIFDPISGDEFRIGAPGAHIEDYGPIVPMLIRVTDPNIIQILVDGGCKAFDNPPQTKADWSMGDGVVEIDGVAYSISDDNYAAEEDSSKPCSHCDGTASFPREFYYQTDRIEMVPCGTCITQGRCPGCMEIYPNLSRDNTPEDVFLGSGCARCGYTEADARAARKTARRWADLVDNPAAAKFMAEDDAPKVSPKASIQSFIDYEEKRTSNSPCDCHVCVDREPDDETKCYGCDNKYPFKTMVMFHGIEGVEANCKDCFTNAQTVTRHCPSCGGLSCGQQYGIPPHGFPMDEDGIYTTGTPYFLPISYTEDCEGWCESMNAEGDDEMEHEFYVHSADEIYGPYDSLADAERMRSIGYLTRVSRFAGSLAESRNIWKPRTMESDLSGWQIPTIRTSMGKPYHWALSRDS